MEKPLSKSRVILYDREIDGERVIHYGLTVDMKKSELTSFLIEGKEKLSFDCVTIEKLQYLRSKTTNPHVCELFHPSGQTLAGWLYEAGFATVRATHNGIGFSARIFDELQRSGFPQDMAGVDAVLGPAIKAVVDLRAPLEEDPQLTAIK